MTPENLELTEWLNAEAKFTAGFLLGYWNQKRIDEAGIEEA